MSQTFWNMRDGLLGGGSGSGNKHGGGAKDGRKSGGGGYTMCHVINSLGVQAFWTNQALMGGRGHDALLLRQCDVWGCGGVGGR